MARAAAVVACLLLVVGAGPAGAQWGMQVADEGTIGGQWMLAADVPLATAAYPTQLAARGDDACIALGYRIGTGGTAIESAYSGRSGQHPDGYVVK